MKGKEDTVSEWQERCPLRAWRDSLGFTQMEAARLLGVSVSTYKIWEQGGGLPSKKAAERIASVAGVPLVEQLRAWHAS